MARACNSPKLDTAKVPHQAQDSPALTQSITNCTFVPRAVPLLHAEQRAWCLSTSLSPAGTGDAINHLPTDSSVSAMRAQQHVSHRTAPRCCQHTLLCLQGVLLTVIFLDQSSWIFKWICLHNLEEAKSDSDTIKFVISSSFHSSTVKKVSVTASGHSVPHGRVHSSSVHKTCPTCRTQSEATSRASTPSSGHSLPRPQLPIRPCSTPGLSTATTTSCLAPPVPAQLPHCHSGPGSAVSVKLIQTMRHLPARARSGSSFPHGYRIPFQQQQLQLSQSAVPPTPGPTAQGQPPTHSPYIFKIYKLVLCTTTLL